VHNADDGDFTEKVGESGKTVSMKGEGIKKAKYFLNKDGYIETLVEIESNFRGKGLSSKLKSRAVELISKQHEIKGFKSVFVKSQSLGDNFDAFMKIYNPNKDNIKEAAFATPAGKTALKEGFTDIDLGKSSVRDNEVVIIFKK
jgi:predicted GNAT family acetyltransferase